MLYVLIIGKHGGYRGRQIIYFKIQNKSGLTSKILSFYIKNPLDDLKKEIRSNWDFCELNKNNESISELVIEQYKDDSLMGYGDSEFSKGGDQLLDQQRGQSLPLLEKFLADNKAPYVKLAVVMEISLHILQINFPQIIL